MGDFEDGGSGRERGGTAVLSDLFETESCAGPK